MPLRVHNDPGHAHFLTFSCFHRRQFLTDTRLCAWLAWSIDKARIVHDFDLWAYVFMPEHVHMLIHPRLEAYSISAILRDIKHPVARSLVAHLEKHDPSRLRRMKARQGRREVHRLWQAGGGYDRNLYQEDAVARAITYIEWNPVTRGLVSAPCGWEWSSARARAGETTVFLAIDALAFDFEIMRRVLGRP